MTGRITFFCVLRAGKKYNAEHVTRLQAAVARNCTLPHRFVALADVEVPCERIPFAHDWPGWWSKIEVFRPGVADPEGLNVYIDLDVLIANNLDAFISHPHRFSMIRDKWTPILPWQRKRARMNSSIMAFSGDYSFIYEEMVAHPRRYQFIFRPVFGVFTGSFGEQALTQRMLRARGKPAEQIDDHFPGSSLVVNLIPRAERKTVKEADMERVLFVSFEGPGAKPGSDRRADNEFVKRYWTR